MAFGDFGGMLPYFVNGFNTVHDPVVAGAQLAQFATLSALPAIGIQFYNYGFEAGLMGKIAFIDYRLEYEYFTGSFQNAFYDQAYDRSRGTKAIDLYTQYYTGVMNSSLRMGILGKMGFSIIDLLHFDVSYKWPWNVNSTEIIPTDNPDHLSARLYFEKDALPFGFGFSLGLDRQFLVPIFIQPQVYQFFDAYTVFNGSIDVPIGNFFKLRATVGTSAKRDDKGNLVYGTNNKPIMLPTLTIESVF